MENEMLKLIYIIIGLAAFVTAASAANAPTIADAQNALTGAQTAWVDLVAAWNALQPVLAFIGAMSAFAASMPHPDSTSALAFPRKMIDWAALAIGHAKPHAHIDTK
jgi:hypothetical protein